MTKSNSASHEEANALVDGMRLSNLVLASIPSKHYGRLQRHLRPVRLKFGQDSTNLENPLDKSTSPSTV
jgi:hypothetical protein